MVHRAVLAFTDDRGAGEDDRQHRNAVDDAHDTRKPGALDIRVEGDADDQIDRHQWGALRPRQVIGDLGRDDLLCVTGSEAGLHHRRGVDVELHRGPASGEDIAGEIGWDVDDERILSGIHQRYDVRFGDRLRRLEIGRQEGMRDPPRQFRVVFVDDRDRRVVHFLRMALRLRDNGQRERINDQPQQHEIAHKAAQFLGTEPIDVNEGVPHADRPSVPASAAAEGSRGSVPG